jgi:MFS family permease
MFDFRPVLRNRSAFAYSLAYCVHTLEMNALRGWGVAFLAWVAGSTGMASGLVSPAVVITVLGLLGTLASVLGNEASIRFGRRRLVLAAMGLSIAVALLVGFLGTQAYWIGAVLIVLYGVVIWLDSSSLTAGAAGSADPARRGATLAVHSMLGYGGGFVGPLMMGWVLDWSGGMSPLAWGLAFASVAATMVLALVAFALLRPAELTGEGSRAAVRKGRS